MTTFIVLLLMVCFFAYAADIRWLRISSSLAFVASLSIFVAIESSILYAALVGLLCLALPGLVALISYPVRLFALKRAESKYENSGISESIGLTEAYKIFWI